MTRKANLLFGFLSRLLAQTGDSSLVLIQCPEGIEGRDIGETAWAAFGSFQKLPKPKYILSQSSDVKEVILTILTFEEKK